MNNFGLLYYIVNLFSVVGVWSSCAGHWLRPMGCLRRVLVTCVADWQRQVHQILDFAAMLAVPCYSVYILCRWDGALVSPTRYVQAPACLCLYEGRALSVSARMRACLARACIRACLVRVVRAHAPVVCACALHGAASLVGSSGGLARGAEVTIV